MVFDLYVEPCKQEYVEAKRKEVVTALQQRLWILISELEVVDLKRTTAIGKGISGDAAIETALLREHAEAERAKLFPNDEELAKRIQESTRVNTMVPAKANRD
jgi:hypothetical protein